MKDKYNNNKNSAKKNRKNFEDVAKKIYEKISEMIIFGPQKFKKAKTKKYFLKTVQYLFPGEIEK